MRVVGCMRCARLARGKNQRGGRGGIENQRLPRPNSGCVRGGVVKPHGPHVGWPQSGMQVLVCSP